MTSVDIAAWWREMRTRCSPFAVRERVTTAELEARVCSALAWIAPANRFVLPPLFHEYLDVLDSKSWYGHGIARNFVLPAPAAIVADAETVTPENYVHHALARETGLFIAIGNLGRDRPQFFLCVDRDRPLCGHVLDAGAGVPPWYEGTENLEHVGTFEEWLANVGGRRNVSHGSRWGMLIGLTPERRVALDPVLVTEDPWQIVVAARDLQFELTYDSTLRQAPPAPERLLYVYQPPPIDHLVIARYAETVVALVPEESLSTFERPRGERAFGAWDANTTFSILEDAGDRLRAMGTALYVGHYS